MKKVNKAPPSTSFIEKPRGLLIVLPLFGSFMQRFSHTYQKWCVRYEELIKSKLPETTIHTVLKWYQVPKSHSINGDVSLKWLYTESFLSITSSSTFLFLPLRVLVCDLLPKSSNSLAGKAQYQISKLIPDSHLRVYFILPFSFLAAV